MPGTAKAGGNRNDRHGCLPRSDPRRMDRTPARTHPHDSPHTLFVHAMRTDRGDSQPSGQWSMPDHICTKVIRTPNRFLHTCPRFRNASRTCVDDRPVGCGRQGGKWLSGKVGADVWGLGQSPRAAVFHQLFGMRAANHLRRQVRPIRCNQDRRALLGTAAPDLVPLEARRTGSLPHRPGEDPAAWASAGWLLHGLNPQGMAKDPRCLGETAQTAWQRAQRALHLLECAGLLQAPRRGADGIEHVQKKQQQVLVHVEPAIVRTISRAAGRVQAMRPDGRHLVQKKLCFVALRFSPAPVHCAYNAGYTSRRLGPRVFLPTLPFCPSRRLLWRGRE